MSLETIAFNYAEKNGYDSFAAGLLRLGAMEQRILIRERKLNSISESIVEVIEAFGSVRISAISEMLETIERCDIVECLERLEQQKKIASSGRPGLREWKMV